MSKVPTFQAFTNTYVGISSVLTSEIGLSLPFQTKIAILPSHNIKAIWDTGASCSAITKKAADILRLIPVSKTIVNTANGSIERNVYYVNIHLPNRVTIQYLKVTECSDLIGDFDMLVGMDVITIGDLAITNHSGQTTMSFRTPSIKKIDFVKQANDLNNKNKIKRKISAVDLRRRKKKQERKNKPKRKK